VSRLFTGSGIHQEKQLTIKQPIFMTLKLEAVKNKKDKTVLLRFNYTNVNRAYFSTGVRIPMDKFNPNSVTEPVKTGQENRTHLNRVIGELYDRIMDLRAKTVREDKVPTGKVLAEKFKKAAVEKSTPKVGDPLVSSMLPQFFANRTNYNEKTIKLYNTMLKQFTDCFGDIRVSEIDLEKWNQFRDYLFEGDRSPNTVNIRMKKLKSFLRFLRYSEGLEFPLNKFPLPPEEIKRLALDLSEVELILDYIPMTAAMQGIKDLCVFQCFTGLRISDLTRLSKLEHIRTVGGKHYIEMRSYKTNTPMTIPLGDTAMEILNRRDFKLPIVVEQHYNRELKKLLRVAGIDRRVDWECKKYGQKIRKYANLADVFTNHCCGRTAIEYFFKMGYSPSEVAAIVGKAVVTIMKYYMAKSTSKSIIDRSRESGASDRDILKAA
jgi:integrase